MKKFSFIVIILLMSKSIFAQQKNFNLIVGTYTKSCESKGIYVYDFNTETADFKLKSSTEKVINPSFLAVSEDNKFVYSVNENGNDSKVSAFGFNPTKGTLTPINTQNAGGADPCYILNDTKNVITANYSGGNISVFKKNPKGGLTEAKQIIQHKGKSRNPQRQEAPHVHMVQFTPDKKYVLANDLGTDKIYIYNYNPDSETNILEIKDSIGVKRGSGPRHLTFSPNGKFAYLLQELDGTITVFAYQNGQLLKLEEAQIVEDDFKGEIGSADIHISPDGKFLYATNRGDANDITTFEIQPNGKLNFKYFIKTGGKGPRNFAIDPSGNFLLVAHQYTNDIIIFKRDIKNGKLTNIGKKIELCSPVCLVFTP
ncbi:6-phosphogluconolactonase [Flavobacterium arsenatis]|uniref:6-phosphogluconolactonase n=1 Tax=Flavobacterium arsenatis TaxID=1484332 RepID=A0ABU1TPI3_9FLAO|nr:lactonase family protein [Flavobacterium arsenatis]MDR6967358.1 6-phosphogluconolactonase [Flavobacterium arsenatis]